MFYPAADLLRAYRDGQVDFEGLAEAYVEELDRAYAEQPELAQWVADMPGLGDFTLLCYERAGDLCHRLVLARWLGEKQPLLQGGGAAELAPRRSAIRMRPQQCIMPNAARMCASNHSFGRQI